MFCKNCNTENADDALFCKKCGSRLEKISFCRKCGARIAPGAKFCSACGAGVEPAAEARPSAPAAEPAPQPAPAMTPAQAYVARTSAPKHRAKNDAVPYAPATKAGKILQKAGLALAIILALVPAVGAFLMGFTLSYGKSTELYYVFGNVFYLMRSGYDNVYGTGTGVSGSLQERYYAEPLSVVFAAIIAAATLITVLIFAVMSVVYCAKDLAGKGGGRGGYCAAATFLIYVAGLVCLMALTDRALDEDIKLNFNAATVIALAICGVALGGYVICTLLSRGKDWNKSTVINAALLLAGCLFCAAVLALCSMPALKFEEMRTEYRSGMIYLYYLVRGRMDEISAKGFGATYSAAAMSIITFLCLCVTVICAALALCKQIKILLSSDCGKPSVDLSIVLVSVSALTLLLTITTKYIYLGEITLSYFPVIMSLVLGAALCAVSAARYFLNKPAKTADDKDTAPKADENKD